MSSTVLNRVNDAEPSLVLFGRDPAGKPRASWFDAGSIDFAMSAAELMQMKIVRVATEQQRAIAKQLARGRIFSSGRAFAPFARAKVYEQLLELERKAADGPSADEAIGAEASMAAAMSSAADRDEMARVQPPTKARRPAVLPLVRVRAHRGATATARRAGTRLRLAVSSWRRPASRMAGGKRSLKASTADEY
jgi:hypothetical protein